MQEAAAPDIEHLLDTELQQHSSLVQGQLSNGLKYVILPNAVPPERFEAHLEICAGGMQLRVPMHHVPCVLVICDLWQLARARTPGSSCL